MNDQQQRNPLFGRGKAQGVNAQMRGAKPLASMPQLGMKPALAGASAASVPATASVKLAVGQTPATAAAGVAASAVAASAKPQVKRDSTLEVMVASMIGTAIEF